MNGKYKSILSKDNDKKDGGKVVKNSIIKPFILKEVNPLYALKEVNPLYASP